MTEEIIERQTYILNAENVEIYKKVENYIKDHYEYFEAYAVKWDLIITEGITSEDFDDGRLEEQLASMLANIKRALNSHFDFIEIVITKSGGEISVVANALVADVGDTAIVPRKGALCKYEDNIFTQEALLEYMTMQAKESNYRK